MNNKKAEGLSLSTVVIAAIVIVVLIVIILIFSGRIGGWNKEVADGCPPGSTGPLPKCEEGLPIKIIFAGDKTEYCCPEKKDTVSDQATTETTVD
jgi:hypothetical protein